MLALYQDDQNESLRRAENPDEGANLDGNAA
jgi:hypothetical protein